MKNTLSRLICSYLLGILASVIPRQAPTPDVDMHVRSRDLGRPCTRKVNCIGGI